MYAFTVLFRLWLPRLGMRRNKHKILNILEAEVSLSRRQFSHIRVFTSVLLHCTFLSWRAGKNNQLYKELFLIRAFHGCFCIESQITLESFPFTFILFDLSSHFFSFLSLSHCLKWLLPHWLQVFAKSFTNYWTKPEVVLFQPNPGWCTLDKKCLLIKILLKSHKILSYFVLKDTCSSHQKNIRKKPLTSFKMN